MIRSPVLALILALLVNAPVSHGFTTAFRSQTYAYSHGTALYASIPVEPYFEPRVEDIATTIAPGPSVWTVFNEVARETGAVNLGQGFPDWRPPQFLLDSLRESVDTEFHQYTRPAGHPPLVELLSQRYSRHLNRDVDGFNEIAVTVGASQALYLALTTLLAADDEVIMFEPFFDLYLKQIALTKAKPVFVSLGVDASNAEPWILDAEALENAITPKTKVLILNSPHNPTGKVFTLDEFNAIADIVRRHPHITVISDEVYKYSVYDPLELGDSTSKGHYHFARLAGMWDRTITLSSCGKTFSVTGWQVGWMVGPSKFIRPVHDLLPAVQFCASTPIQHALTLALQVAEKPYENFPNYYEWLRQQFISKRLILEEGLIAAGLEPIPSRGGFFLMAKLPYYPSVDSGSDINEPYDYKFCRYLAKEYGVLGIPASPFFRTKSKGDMPAMARFAFCKKDKTILEAANRLKRKI